MMGLGGNYDYFYRAEVTKHIFILPLLTCTLFKLNVDRYIALESLENR